MFRQRTTFEGLVERHTGSGETENKVSLLCGCILESEQSSGVWVIALICVRLMADCVEVKVIISESHQGGKGQQSRKYWARGWIQNFVCCLSLSAFHSASWAPESGTETCSLASSGVFGGSYPSFRGVFPRVWVSCPVPHRCRSTLSFLVAQSVDAVICILTLFKFTAKPSGT